MRTTTQRVRFWTVTQTGLLLIFGGLLTANFIRVQHVAHQTHAALCSFHQDLRNRADSTQDYLSTHPGKYVIAGLTRAEVKRALRSQRAALKALDGLGCPEPIKTDR